MDVLTVSIGVAALVYGLYTLWARTARPEAFGKLDAMKQRFGSRAGGAIHVFAYTAVPILFGLFVIYLGLQGVEFF